MNGPGVSYLKKNLQHSQKGYEHKLIIVALSTRASCKEGENESEFKIKGDKKAPFSTSDHTFSLILTSLAHFAPILAAGSSL